MAGVSGGGGTALGTLDPEFTDESTDDFSDRQPDLAFVKAEPHAVVGGINIHAGIAFDARDKPRMEHRTPSCGQR